MNKDKTIIQLSVMVLILLATFTLFKEANITGLAVYEESTAFEAEGLTVTGEYSISSNCACTDPSNQCIKHSGKKKTGSVEYEFDLEDGLYDIAMKHCPEDDGNDIYKLYVNNNFIKAFEETSDSGIWEEHIFDNIELNQGDNVKISCTDPEDSTYCRIDQIIFKKIRQTVDVNETIEDADKIPINSTIRWIRSGEVMQESSGEIHNYKLEQGDYDLEIIPDHKSIKKIRFNKKVNSDISDIVDVDEDPSPDTEYSQTYAIEPKDPEIEDATVTITATGTELFKCKEWDFENRECEEEWFKLMDTIPGQEYSFTVDCGYKEKGGCTCKGIRFVDLFSSYSLTNGNSYSVTVEVFKGSGTSPSSLLDSETINFNSLPKYSIDSNPGDSSRGNLIIEEINQSGILIKFHNTTQGRLLGDNTFKITIDSNTLGPDTIHLSCSQPVDIGDDFGDFKVIDIDKIFSGSDCQLPVLNLISIANNSVINTSNVTLEYTVYDTDQTISYCELIINGSVYQTDYSIIENIPQYFNISLANGTYSWSVNCTTSNNYEAASDTWYFTISSTSPGDKPPEIKLNYPPNIFNAEAFDNYTLTFNCSAEDKQGTNKGIKNISLYLTDYQNNNFNLNETITFSGTNQEETALFTKTLLIGNYTWNCLVYDNGNNFDWAANRTLKIKKKQNETIKNASCCCGLQVSAAPEIAGQNEKVLIAADVSNLLTGLAATPSEITDLNISIYKVDNNTYTTIIIDIPMTYLSDGLWYYEFYTKNNATGTYIASVKMLTNQTTPFIKEASSAFTIGEKISGLTIIGVSPDLINTNKTARLAAEIKYNGIAVDSSLISNASLVIEKINGSAQNYTPQIDDGIIYLDGAFNETGIYYLDWTAAYLMQTRTAREIIVIVDWEELLEDINETVNVELLNLIKENRQYLLELLTDMEFLQEFSEEEIFLITDSVNSMTKVIDYLEKGDITNEEAEQQFNQIRQDLEDQLGIKLTGSAIGITSADIKPSPFKNLGEKLKDWRSLLFFILLLMVSMTLIIILMLTRIIKTGYADKPIKQIKIKRKQPKTYEKRRYEILIDKIRQKLESRKSKPVEIQPKSIRIKEDYVNSLNQFLLNAVDKGCTKGDIKIMLINKGWSRSFVDNYCDKFFEENKEKFIKRKI